MTDDESERLRRRFAERVRPHFKGQLWTTIYAFLCECEMFQRMSEAGAPFVRGYEGAPIDGALICPGSIAPPAGVTSVLDTWQWAIEQEDVEFIPFDVKSVALHPSLTSTKNLDYSYSRPPGKPGFNKGGAELFFLRFEEFDDYTAIVPKAVFESASGVAYGINGLISGVPCIWHPYMVHDSDLLQAIRNLTNINAYYKNPTTGVTFTGFRPLRTRRPAITPTARAPKTSMRIIRQLFREIQHSEHEVSVDFNPIAPLVGDCVLKIPGVSDLLCVEHKHRITKDFNLNEESGRRSPYAKNRLWHFLIYQSNGLPSRYICFARHEVDESWIENPPHPSDLRDPEKYCFEGDNAIDGVIQKIKDQAILAIETVNKIIEDMRPHDSDIESLVAGNHIDTAVELSQELASAREEQLEEEQNYVDAELMDDDDGNVEDGDYQIEVEDKNDGEDEGAGEGEGEGEGESGLSAVDDPGVSAAPSHVPTFVTDAGYKHYKVGGLLWNSVGLHWMCEELNKQCCAHGRMLCFPLDHGHPLGNHVLVDYQWTENDKAVFTENKILPLYVFSPDMQNATAIVLRFVDFSWTNSKSKTWPLWMRGRYWTRPAIRQHFMFIASIQHGTTKAEAGSSYLFYPSFWTTIFRQGCRDEPKPHRGEDYFRNSLKGIERLPEPSWEYPNRQRRFDKGSEFIPWPAESPLRCILDLDDHSLYSHLLELMEQKQPSLVIKNPQSDHVNDGFSIGLHKIKVGLLWETAWNFGLARRTPRISERDELRRRRLEAAADVPDYMEPLPDIDPDYIKTEEEWEQ